MSGRSYYQKGDSVSHGRVDSNFRDVVRILNQQGTVFWVNEGSLLGLVRDGKLIEWDHDIDISFFSPGINLEELRDLLSRAGFKAQFSPLRRPDFPRLKLTRKCGRIVDLSIYRLREFGGQQYWAHEWYHTDKFPPRTIKRKGALVLLRLVHRCWYSTRFGLLKTIGFPRSFEAVFRSLHSSLSISWGLEKTVGYYIDIDFLSKIVYRDYEGVACPIPLNAEGVLSRLYGNSWSIPQRSTRWTDFMSAPPNAP